MAPGARPAGSWHMIRPADGTQSPDEVTYVSPTGIGSFTTIPVAVDGPAFPRLIS